MFRCVAHLERMAFKSWAKRSQVKKGKMKISFVIPFYKGEINVVALCHRLAAMLVSIIPEREIFLDEYVMLESSRTGVVRVVNGIVTRERKGVIVFALFVIFGLVMEIWYHFYFM